MRVIQGLRVDRDVEWLVDRETGQQRRPVAEGVSDAELRRYPAVRCPVTDQRDAAEFGGIRAVGEPTAESERAVPVTGEQVAADGAAVGGAALVELGAQGVGEP